jgi:hypothetical protein
MMSLMDQVSSAARQAIHIAIGRYFNLSVTRTIPGFAGPGQTIHGNVTQLYDFLLRFHRVTCYNIGRQQQFLSHKMSRLPQHQYVAEFCVNRHSAIGHAA